MSKKQVIEPGAIVTFTESYKKVLFPIERRIAIAHQAFAEASALLTQAQDDLWGCVHSEYPELKEYKASFSHIDHCVNVERKYSDLEKAGFPAMRKEKENE